MKISEDMRRLVQILFFVLLVVSPVGAETADKFAIRIATLAGGEGKTVVQNSWQQMSHPRVSPDGEWITFTRYNEKHWGFAKEEDGYEETEIMLVRLDGSALKTLIPPKPDILNCNSSWMGDGRSLVWMSTDNTHHLPWLMKIEIATGKITRIPTPEKFKTTDPHILGDRIVFPVIEDVDSIWTMKLDGSDLRQVTHPVDPGGFRWFALPVGDYDPKFSPDGKEIAFMRLMKSADWRIFVVNIETGKERNLSGDNVFDIVPDWSSDGRLIIFPHIDTKDLSELGLYTMKPDGSDRKIIPLPGGAVLNQPQFFPNSGSGPDAKFVYQAMKFS